MPDSTTSTLELSQYACLRVQGADASKFLQGQLSSDVTRLATEPSLLAGLHNPQGRVLCVLRLLALAPEDIALLLPAELASSIATRLRKYMLRARVRIEDETAQWRIEGSWTAPAPGARAVASVPGPAPLGTRYIALRARDALGAVTAADETLALRWHADDIAAALPQVYAATSELFIGQMLNLDVLDAISFSKGCYTGQEVIARAHYRGRVKRRMQRFATHAAMSIAPGTSHVLRDGRAVRVVDAVRQADGRCEFLAVVPLAQGADTSEPGHETAGATILDCELLDLPYALPE